MLEHLPSVSSRADHSAGGTILSFVVHGTLVAAAVWATAEPRRTRESPDVHELLYVEQAKADAPAPRPVSAPSTPAPGAPGDRLLVVAPDLDIPTTLPAPGTAMPPMTAEDWTRGTGSSEPANGDGASAANGAPLAAWQVERPAVPLPGAAAPRYPDVLRSAGVEGEALVAFVVDTTGRADPSSFTVLHATHALFAAAVRTALPAMRFAPAEANGRKVRQLVQQPFVFAITR